MAEKRMFAKSIIDSDAFLDMPVSAQALYFHLSMRADDDGFVGSPKKISRMVGASEDDMKILIAKRFIIAFDSGVIVIKHWRINNYLRSDRYHGTNYTEEKKQLKLKENKAYTLSDDDGGIPLGTPTVDADKNSIDKNSIEENRLDKNKGFVIPTVQDVKAYCIERGNSVDPEAFIDFYESKGWMVGKNKMKDWRAAVRTWEKNRKAKPSNDWIMEVEL